MIVKWNVDTGYVNREPARTLEIDDEDMTDAQKEDYICECIEQAFRDTITWHRVDK